jgi:hypothetical protein
MTAPRYDVALSFAGEDRAYARKVADALQTDGVSVFFDEFESVRLWGKDLAVEFSLIYGRQARFVVPLVSGSYASKAWPRHEFRNALAAAVQSEGERILPVRLDDTELPGLRSTIGYLDGRTLGPEAIAHAVREKLGESASRSSEPEDPGGGVEQASVSFVAGHQIEGDLGQRIRQRGYWQTEILPSQVKENRLKISRGLIPLVHQQSVALRGWDFPHVDLNTPPQIELDSIGQDTEWNHCHELWRLFKSGKLLHLAGMRHDWGAPIQLSVSERETSDSPLLGVGDVVFRFTEIVEFTARFANGLLSGEDAAARVEVGGLQGRRLVLDDPGRIAHSEARGATTRRPFLARIEVTPAATAGELRKRARQCAHEFYALFGFEIDDAVLEGWQGKIGSW